MHAPSKEICKIEVGDACGYCIVFHGIGSKGGSTIPIHTESKVARKLTLIRYTTSLSSVLGIVAGLKS